MPVGTIFVPIVAEFAHRAAYEVRLMARCEEPFYE
jgi:hypothetical protein